MADAELVIDWIGGNCPVQAEGSIAGRPFYFRARWKSWSFSVGEDSAPEPEWSHVEQWGDGPYAAGWMDEETAREMIEKAAGLYLAARAEGPAV